MGRLPVNQSITHCRLANAAGECTWLLLSPAVVQVCAWCDWAGYNIAGAEFLVRDLLAHGCYLRRYWINGCRIDLGYFLARESSLRARAGQLDV